MIIVDVTGGFANQLFRYTAGYQLSKKFNKEMIIQTYDKECFVDAYLLDELNIRIHKKIVAKTGNDMKTFALEYGYNNVILVNDANYLEILNQEYLDDSYLYYLDDNFQKTCHFIGVINDIRQMFTPKHMTHIMREFKDRVERENSVGIHVRRRDFIDYRNTVTGNCEDKFYLAAISFFREKLETPRFYIFSDDITFCKNYFGQSTDIHYVKIIGGKYADIEEFFCLSWCRHKILTRGSSYGRMADVLNSNQSKITLYKGSEENKDNIIYLDSNKINQYAEIYAEQIENKGKISNAIDKHSKIDKEENKDNYFEDAKEKYDICEFKDAELTLLRGWQYGFRNLDYIFLYVNTLIKNQKFEEACLVATSYVKLGGEINNFTSMFPENMINRIINYSNSKMNTIVIIPCEPFKNGELNYLCNLGIMMQKMGCKVHYIFNEATDEDRAVDNEILNNNYMYTNCRGYKYNSRMYNKKIIEKQYDLSEFIREISNGEECTVITDDYSVLKSADKESFKKVFWNARNTYRMKTICKDVEELKGLGIDLIITEREQDNQDESIFKIAPIRWSYEVNGELRLYEQYKYSAFLYDVIDRIMLFRKTNL